jgi:hypothetical protein
MASRYDELDASTELEQQLASDLKAALEPRGCVVIHNGTNSGGRHSPGGKPDIEIIDKQNRRKILVEVTRRKGSAADGEFPAVTAHLNAAVAAGGFDDYGLIYVSPRTSARMSTNFRDLYNRTRERDGQPGRIVGLDFEATQLLLDKLAGADPQLYPSSRLGQLLSRWADAVDDARARLLVQRTIFPEDLALSLDLAQEAKEFDAEREKELKKGLLKVENDFRNHGITGNNANITLVYLAFIRLFEERRQRRTGSPSRFTLDGFRNWCAGVPAITRTQYKDRMVEALLHELAEEGELREAGLLQPSSGVKPAFHHKLSDALVEKQILPLFDGYDFHAGRLLAAVGVYLLVLAVRRLRSQRLVHNHQHDPHNSGHDADHHHAHDDHRHHHHHHHDDHPHDDHPHDRDGHAVAVATPPLLHRHGGRSHTHAPVPEGPLSWRALAGMGVAGGLVPSPRHCSAYLGKR